MTNQQNFEEVYLQHKPILYSYASKYKNMLCNTIDIDDLLQTATIGLYKAYRTYDASKGTQFKTHAIRCIMNQLNMLYKKYSKEPLDKIISLDYEYDDSADDKAMSLVDLLVVPESDTNQDDMRILNECINDVFKRYNDKQQKIIVLIVKHDMKQREVAELLGMWQDKISRTYRAFINDVKKEYNKYNTI